MKIYKVEPELDVDGDAVCEAGDDETVYIDRKMFEALADAFGLAVIRMPKSRDEA